MEFSRQEYWGRLPFPTPGDLPNPRFETFLYFFALRLLFCPLNSPGKNTGVDSHSLLQGIFPTQGLNPNGLQADSLPSEPPGKPPGESNRTKLNR